jgi:hypothetical protein
MPHRISNTYACHPHGLYGLAHAPNADFSPAPPHARLHIPAFVPKHSHFPHKALLVVLQPRNLVVVDPHPCQPVHEQLCADLLVPELARRARGVVVVRPGFVGREARGPRPAHRRLSLLCVRGGAHECAALEGGVVARVRGEQPRLDVHDELHAELFLDDAPEVRGRWVARAVPDEVVAVVGLLVCVRLFFM